MNYIHASTIIKLLTNDCAWKWNSYRNGLPGTLFFSTFSMRNNQRHMNRLYISKTKVIRSCLFYDCENDQRNYDLHQCANKMFLLILVQLNRRNNTGLYVPTSNTVHLRIHCGNEYAQAWFCKIHERLRPEEPLSKLLMLKSIVFFVVGYEEMYSLFIG